MFESSVVYLSVHAPPLTRLHRRILEVVLPSLETSQEYFEGTLYVPHLTLGQSSWGLTSAELHDMYDEARTVGSMLASFTATRVQIFRGLRPEAYVAYLDVPLGEETPPRNS